MSLQKTVETRIATISIDENEIISIIMKDCGMIDEYDIVDLNLVMRNISGGKPALKLFDGRGRWSMNKKARERAKLENSPQHAIARAVVVSNLIKATLFRFLNELGKKGYPQEFFSNREDAYNWLMDFKKNQSLN